MMQPVSCDEDGMVHGFPYHDGFLDGVVVTRDGETEVHLSLRSSRGEQRILTLRSVEALYVGGFREGNVVLNLRVLSAASAADDTEVRRVLHEALSLDTTSLKTDARVFLLESSFGAEVIAVCAGVEVSETGFLLVPWRETRART